MKKLIAIALAVLMIATLTSVAFAEGSPTGDVYRKVTYTLKYADGTTETMVKEAKDGEQYVVEAPAKDGNEFVDMTISGDYEKVTRAATTETFTTSKVTIIPHSDIEVIVNYKKAASNPQDNGNTSPNTGVDYTLVALAVLMGIFGMAVATKKIFVK